ncbi:MAG: RNA ligase family protein, partial [Nanoarchaeota archaeon]
MSKHICEIVKIKIRPHLGSDSLSIVDIRGWQCVIKTADFNDGDLAVYIPIDMVVPEKPEFEFLRSRHFRVKTIKLRKEVSMGLIMPFSILPSGNYMEGQDVTELIGVKRWEPKEEFVGFRDAKAISSKKVPEEFTKYTSIENIKNFKNLVNEFEDEVVLTEKIHGSNIRIGWVKSKWYVGSHNTVRDPQLLDNVYTQQAVKFNLKKKVLAAGAFLNGQFELADKILHSNLPNWLLKVVAFFIPDIVFYCEVYGANIQKGFNYDLTNEQHIIFFDIKFKDKYLSLMDLGV